MANILVFIIIITIIFGAVAKIISEKKRGVKCIGCPYSQSGEGKCNCDNLK